MKIEDEEDSSMGFLDNLVDQHQIKKLEKERKRQILTLGFKSDSFCRRLENEGEDFEVVKRSFVSENDQAKKSLLPVLNPDTQQVEQKYKILEQKVDEETDSEVDETEDPNEKPLTATDIVNLQNEMKQTWPKRLANVSYLKFSSLLYCIFSMIKSV